MVAEGNVLPGEEAFAAGAAVLCGEAAGALDCAKAFPANRRIVKHGTNALFRLRRNILSWTQQLSHRLTYSFYADGARRGRCGVTKHRLGRYLHPTNRNFGSMIFRAI